VLSLVVQKAPSQERKGRRPDTLFSFDDKDYVVDYSGVQSTAKTYRTRTAKALAQEADDATGDARTGSHLPYNATMVARQNAKHVQYKPVMELAALHHKQGLRQSAPVFLAPCFTNSGELSEDFFKLIEVVAMAVKAKAVRSPPKDGATPAMVAARARSAMKDAVACGIASGVGRLMQTGGFPMSCRPRRPWAGARPATATAAAAAPEGTGGAAQASGGAPSRALAFLEGLSVNATG